MHRLNTKDMLKQPMEWLVRFQCIGESVEDIAQISSTTADEVRCVICHAAGLIDLGLRDGITCDWDFCDRLLDERERTT